MRATALLVLLIGACGTNSNNIGPGSDLPPGICDPSPFLPTVSRMGDGLPVCVPGGDTNCTCEPFSPDYPQGVVDNTQTENASVFHPPGAAFDGNAIEGCASVIHYQWPDCALVAELGGTVMNEPESPFGIGDDEDYTFNTCPTAGTTRVDPFTTPPMEIRGQGSWQNVGSPFGRIHIEIQECRYFNGTWHINDPSIAASTVDIDARPGAGDMVSAAGDWLTDDNNGTFHQDHTGWTELHEARIVAKTKPFTSTVSYSFVSAIFTEQTRQADELLLDVVVPPSPGGAFTKLQCSIVGQGADTPNANNTRAHGPACGVNAALAPPIADSASGTCRIHLTQPLARTEFNCQGTCNGRKFGECGSPTCDSNCQEACVPPLQPGEHATPGRCPFQEQCGAADTDCDRLGGVFVVRAEWLDPGDSWICENCACDDPSKAGALFETPVQGCATPGLDPTSAADQEEACQQVCGGLTCGAAPACVIGACNTPASSAHAELVGRNSCDPTQPSPQLRVSRSGDFHVTIDSGSSSAVITVDGHNVTKPVSGEFVLNVSADGHIIDFSRAYADIADFSIEGTSIANARVFTAQRLFGAMATPPFFEIPDGTGVFGVRAMVDGAIKGINVVNADALNGTLDLASGFFSLDIAADETDEGDKHLHAHLEGHIDDHPPAAVSGGPVRTVECTGSTTPVVLDGSASSDPDPGDSITHYQWFTNAGAAIGNEAQEHVSLMLGNSLYVLHVYDGELGSAESSVDVNVVDTTSPSLDLAPAALCLWPPSHRRAKFTLGVDLVASAHDVCDPMPSVKIVAVTSNEPDNGLGDGDTAGDATYSDQSFCVRRERSGSGNGRTYTVAIEASDASGNTTRRNLTVTVPHSNTHCGSAGTDFPDGIPCR